MRGNYLSDSECLFEEGTYSYFSFQTRHLLRGGPTSRGRLIDVLRYTKQEQLTITEQMKIFSKLAVPYLDVFGHTVFLKLVSGWFSDTQNRPEMGLRVQKDAFREGYLCLLKRFFVLENLKTIQFSFYIKHAWKKRWRNIFELSFFG